MPGANGRLEAMCDGVFAIAMTLLIIDVRIPPTTAITTTADLWLALQHLAPTVAAFLLSFAIIFITWVNHHASLKLVNGATGAFLYANGFLLLTVVIMPFPTALLGMYLLTDHAAPAVVLYNAVIVAQAIGWILVSGSALRGHLTIDEHGTEAMRASYRKGFIAIGFYSALAIAAFWFPLESAIVTMLSWIAWLVLGIRMRHV